MGGYNFVHYNKEIHYIQIHYSKALMYSGGPINRACSHPKLLNIFQPAYYFVLHKKGAGRTLLFSTLLVYWEHKRTKKGAFEEFFCHY